MHKVGEIDDFAVATSRNHDEISANISTNQHNSVSLYQKCLSCPDYGVSCNGPKLAALGDIMVVRDFHRAIRNQRSIPMKLLYTAAQPISESTINDYFSHSEKDFKWTTVGCIDNALTAICGNRVGQPLLDHPCPASSTEIQEKIGNITSKIEQLSNENAEYQLQIEALKRKVREAQEEVKEDYASRVRFLKELADDRYRLILKRDRWIIALCVITAISLVLASIYFAWDMTTPTEGFLHLFG